MSDDIKTVKVAVIQAASVLFDREATVSKACQLIQEAASEGAELLLFPEAFIPAYPRGLSFGMVVGSRKPEGRALWQTYWDGAVEIPSPTTEVLGAAVRDAGVYLGDRGYRAGCALQRRDAVLHHPIFWARWRDHRQAS